MITDAQAWELERLLERLLFQEPDNFPLLQAIQAVLADEPRRCPRCGSFAWVYKGDRQVCADCGK